MFLVMVMVVVMVVVMMTVAGAGATVPSGVSLIVCVRVTVGGTGGILSRMYDGGVGGLMQAPSQPVDDVIDIHQIHVGLVPPVFRGNPQQQRGGRLERE
jgi:hypothetical protein